MAVAGGWWGEPLRGEGGWWCLWWRGTADDGLSLPSVRLEAPSVVGLSFRRCGGRRGAAVWQVAGGRRGALPYLPPRLAWLQFVCYVAALRRGRFGSGVRRGCCWLWCSPSGGYGGGVRPAHESPDMRPCWFGPAQPASQRLGGSCSMTWWQLVSGEWLCVEDGLWLVAVVLSRG